MKIPASIIAASVLLAIAASSPPVIAEGEKVKLEWQVAERECMYYECILPKQAKRPDGEPIPDDGGPIVGENQPTPRKARPVVLFGYEVDARGFRRPAFPVQDLEQAVVQVAGAVPRGSVRQGSKWTEDWEFDGSRSLTPPGLVSSYELVSLAEREGHGMCARIKASHALSRAETATAAKRWENLSVTTECWFSVDAHCMVECEAILTGMTNEQKTAAGPATNDKLTWKLRGRFDSTQAASLNRKSEDALVKGVDYLWARRGKSGGWNAVFRPRGGTALALTTLLSCGIRADDPRITESFRTLAEFPLDRTYEAAVSCMAYEALLIRRRADMQDPAVTLSRDELRELERVVKWLLDGRQTNDSWRYSPAPTGKPWFTTSILEFTLCGLAAAQRAGAAVPVSVARRAAEEVLARQAVEGEVVKRVIAGEYKKDGVKVTRNPKPVQARGWTYERQVGTGDDPNLSKAYGSMTCAGINCLASALELLQNADKAERNKEFGGAEPFKRWKLKITESVASGLAWLELNYMVSHNPGEGWSQENQGQYFCYLHSLERCCTFSETEWLGEHNWYDEGRAALIMSQKEEGNWVRLVMDDADTVEDTCFAVLFLKKSILKPRWPVFTQKEAD